MEHIHLHTNTHAHEYNYTLQKCSNGFKLYRGVSPSRYIEQKFNIKIGMGNSYEREQIIFPSSFPNYLSRICY